MKAEAQTSRTAFANDVDDGSRRLFRVPGEIGVDNGNPRPSENEHHAADKEEGGGQAVFQQSS